MTIRNPEKTIPHWIPDLDFVSSGMTFGSVFLTHWIDLKKKDRTIERLYNYWILGQGAVEKKVRWSIIRNVLHWVE